MAPHLNLVVGVVAIALCIPSSHLHPPSTASSTFSPSEENVFEAAFQGDCETHSPCQHLCFDLHDGTFECACRDDHFLSDNGYSCIPYDSSERGDEQHPLNQLQEQEEQSDQRDDQSHPSHPLSSPPPSHPHPQSSSQPHPHLTPRSRQLSSTLQHEDEEANHLFSSHSSESEDEDEEVDLDQFSSTKSKMFFMEKRQREEQPRPGGGGSGIIEQQSQLNLLSASFRTGDTDTQNTDPSSLSKKSDDETSKSGPSARDSSSSSSSSYSYSFDKLNGRQNFNSCSEIECEAGGICVSESTADTSSSQSSSSSFSSFSSSTVDPSVITGEEVTPASTSNLQSSRLAMATSERTSNPSQRVRCRCPLGRKGFFCEKPSEVRFPRFRGSSYLALPTLKDAEKSMQLNIEFRPEQYEGLILYSGEKQTLEGDFVAVLLNQGFVEFRFDCGMGEGVVRSERPVVLNSWNRVTVYRDGWTAWLTLNGGQQVSGQSQGLFTQITFQLELFLGGSPNLTLVSQRTNSFTGLTGCVRKLEINGRQYDFRADNRGDSIDGVDIEECGADVCSRTVCLNGGQCVASTPDKGICLCPLGFGGVNCELESAFTVPSFNGSSYLQFPGLEDLSSGLYLEIQIVFKPRSLDGVILYNGQRMDGGGDFVSINLVDGFVEFRFNPGNGPAVIRSLSPIELNEWHTIYASRTAMMGALQVDDQPEVGGFSVGAFTQLSLPLNMFIGGVSDMKDVSRDAALTQSLVGCVQRVVLNGRTLNLLDEALFGVNVADCPHPCQSNPCQRGGKCDPVLDSYVCHCPLGLVGENCQRDVEEMTVPMFYGNSYLHYTDDSITKRIRGSKMDLHIRFRAFAPEGLLIWSGDQNKTSNNNDFMAVSLEEGLVKYTYNLGSGEVTLINNYSRVDDGVWHSLRLTRFERKGSLRLDSWPSVTGVSPGSHIQLNVLNGLYLGGLDDVLHQTRRKHKNGVIGCISHMTLSQDYHVMLITQANKQVNTRTCI